MRKPIPFIPTGCRPVPSRDRRCTPKAIARIKKILTTAQSHQDFRPLRRRNTIADPPANPVSGQFHRPLANELR
jgi:hypothetical protein